MIGILTADGQDGRSWKSDKMLKVLSTYGLYPFFLSAFI